MPPPSSPVPRLSSVPSAASTVHTIASRSPLRPIVPALRERDGRPPRPLLGDAIATTTPPHRQRTAATGQRLDGLPSCLLVLVLVLFLQVVRKGIANEQTEQEEREPGRRLPPTSSPVLPFRLRLRFLLFFAMISSARSHLFALPSSCLSFLALLPDD